MYVSAPFSVYRSQLKSVGRKVGGGIFGRMYIGEKNADKCGRIVSDRVYKNVPWYEAARKFTMVIISHIHQ